MTVTFAVQVLTGVPCG